MNKIYLILLAILLSSVLGYKNINGILELNAKDLKELPSISPRLLVKYYVPWYTCQDKGAIIVNNLSTFTSNSLKRSRKIT